MSQWQFTKNGVPTKDATFDDAQTPLPGDPGFSTAAVAAQLATLTSGANGFNYMGPSAALQDDLSTSN